MLCKASKEVPEGDYIYQEKFDGCRAVAIISKRGDVKLINRRGVDITSRYPEVADNLKASFKESCVVDGEICCLNSKGVSDFNRLQHREHLKNKALLKVYMKQYPSVFFAFDIIGMKGEVLDYYSLKNRLQMLKENYRAIQDTNIFLVENFTDGKKLFESVKKKGGEGIIAKAINGKYVFRRSDNWLKIKVERMIDLEVIGYTSEKRDVSALMTNNGKVNFSMSGMLRDYWEKKIKEVAEDIQANNGFISIKPRRIFAEISYLEMTKDKCMRFPKLVKLYEIEEVKNDSGFKNKRD